ncbi:HK97 family phage prohead protease [Micromonospora aurantiaca (nom. illeg.)]|uniref:HK97 family phage prohead protease n=1 Tax=Micromonospora aurantiaca (nom. illeg.) TaxID=47850 RepID=UPI0033C880E1
MPEPQRREIPPRTELLRTAPFALRSDSGDNAGDGLTLDGFAAVFNRQTLIDSWEGKFWEQISPGSMRKSFRENPPKIQFDHGHHPLIGSIPIARTTTAEEAVDADLAPEGGAHIVGRLHDNWLVQPVRDAIAAGSVDGMSFRFSVVREEWREADGKVIRDEDKLREILRRSWYEDVPDEELPLRTLKELRVPEAGPVTWPAYTDTSVSVRSKTVTIDLGRLHDPEQRRLLARAVLLADATSTTDAPPANQGQPDEHPAIPAAPPVDRTSSGEHPSATPTRKANPAREFAQHARGYILNITERK